MSPPVRIAAFDLDDTVIAGNSQELFVRFLKEQRLAPAALRRETLWWGALYALGWKLEVPKIHARLVRCCSTIPRDVFRAALRQFAESTLPQRIRPDARARMATVRDEGCHVLLLSATIHPLVEWAAAALGADGYTATQVALDDPRHIAVLGEMVYGEAKVAALQRYADARFPSWRLQYAFGNDYQDRFLLSGAATPVAVCPSPELRTHAEREGWACEIWA